MKTVIFDIDGTLADCQHRRHHVEKEPKDWDSFFREDLVLQDAVIEPVRDLYVSLVHDFYVVLATGRSEDHRRITQQWLREAGMVQHEKLYMRAAGDRRHDYVVKEEILAQIKADGFNPFLVIDDRKSVVEMWRKNGLVCLQAAEGDF